MFALFEKVFSSLNLSFWSKRENSHNQKFLVKNGDVLSTVGDNSPIQRAENINNYVFAPTGSGGRGGSATVRGNGIAIGGSGGNAGPGGAGGDGGSGYIEGDGIALGGEGGEAGQLCKGGKGGRSPMEAHGLPNRQLPDGSWLWDYGRGGDGASPPR